MVVLVHSPQHRKPMDTGSKARSNHHTSVDRLHQHWQMMHSTSKARDSQPGLGFGSGAERQSSRKCTSRKTMQGTIAPSHTSNRSSFSRATARTMSKSSPRLVTSIPVMTDVPGPDAYDAQYINSPTFDDFQRRCPFVGCTDADVRRRKLNHEIRALQTLVREDREAMTKMPVSARTRLEHQIQALEAARKKDQTGATTASGGGPKAQLRRIGLSCPFRATSARFPTRSSSRTSRMSSTTETLEAQARPKDKTPSYFVSNTATPLSFSKSCQRPRGHVQHYRDLGSVYTTSISSYGVGPQDYQPHWSPHPPRVYPLPHEGAFAPIRVMDVPTSHEHEQPSRGPRDDQRLPPRLYLSKQRQTRHQASAARALAAEIQSIRDLP